MIQTESASPRRSLPLEASDLKEAARNFEVYLRILREWDEKARCATASEPTIGGSDEGMVE